MCHSSTLQENISSFNNEPKEKESVGQGLLIIEAS
jgi:hypothetical protein